MSFSHGTFYSYADLTRPGALALVGRALDADSDLRPSILDTKVPPRRRVESSAEVIAEAEAAGFAKICTCGGGTAASVARGASMPGETCGHHRTSTWVSRRTGCETSDHLVDLVVSNRRQARRADVQLDKDTGAETSL